MTIPFAQPLWLLAGIVICILAAAFIRFHMGRRQQSLSRFASPHLLPALTSNVSGSQRRIKNILFLLALALLFTALARPQYGNRWVEVKQKGIDILIGVDVSKSMLVRDITPNRLERAKLAIRDFVNKLEGDRVGLLPFAGTAFLMCPLTTDHEAFLSSLEAMDVNTIPKGGTNIGGAITKAMATLSNEANHKLFVLITDGEDLSAEAVDAAREAKKNNMIVYTIGVGTPEGELIPSQTTKGGQFVKNADGQFVTSKLDEQTLLTIAEITNGLYAPLGSMGEGLETVYQKKLALVPREEHGQRKRKIPIERFPWAIAPAVILLTIDFLLTGRKKQWSLGGSFMATVSRRRKKQSLSAVLLLFALLFSAHARAADGEKFYQEGKYGQAVEVYKKSLKKDPDNPVLHYNLGAASYKNQNYEQAAKEFSTSLQLTDDLSLQSRNYFNLGNSQFLLGKKYEQTDPDKTKELWEQAKKSYEANLALNKQDKEAAPNRKNQNIVTEELKKLKRKQKQEKENKQNSQKPQNKEQNQKSGENKHKGQKDQKKQKKQKEQKNQQSSAQNTQKKTPQENKTDKNSANPRKTPQSKDDKKQSRPPQPGQKNNDQQMSQQDKLRRKAGKMTSQEAKNLLNSLKSEQGELNFIPQGSADNDNFKDW